MLGMMLDDLESEEIPNGKIKTHRNTKKIKLMANQLDSNIELEVVPFANTLWSILNTVKFEPYISWNSDGKCIIIKDIHGFQMNVLPAYFSHSNHYSFVRQLNLYGFAKTMVDPSWREFANPNFIRYKPELLSNIKRKPRTVNRKMSRANKEATQMDKITTTLKHDVEHTDVLMRELVKVESHLGYVNDNAAKLKVENAGLEKELGVSSERQGNMRKRLFDIMQFLKKFFDHIDDKSTMAALEDDVAMKELGDMLNLLKYYNVKDIRSFVPVTTAPAPIPDLPNDWNDIDSLLIDYEGDDHESLESTGSKRSISSITSTSYGIVTNHVFEEKSLSDTKTLQGESKNLEEVEVLLEYLDTLTGDVAEFSEDDEEEVVSEKEVGKNLEGVSSKIAKGQLKLNEQLVRLETSVANSFDNFSPEFMDGTIHNNIFTTKKNEDMVLAKKKRRREIVENSSLRKRKKATLT